MLKNRLLTTALLSAMISTLLCGCSEPHTQEMTKKVWFPESATWPELEGVIVDTEGKGKPSISRLFQAVQQDAETSPNFAFFNSTLSDPHFQSRLKAFESTPIPEKYRSAQRETAKTNFLKAIQDLTTKAKTGKGDLKELKDQLDLITKYYNQLKFIPDQHPPEGAQQKAYSGIAPYVDPYAK